MAKKRPSPGSTLTRKKRSYRRIKLRLKPGDRKVLAEMAKGKKHSARTFKRMRILQLLDSRKTFKQIAQGIGVGQTTIREVKQRYLEGGLERILYEAPRGKAERAINDKQGQRIVAMLCGSPPTGRARWTVRLVRDEAIDRGIVPKVGRESIRVLMSNHELKPWREKNVVHSGVDVGIHSEDGASS